MSPPSPGRPASVRSTRRRADSRPRPARPGPPRGGPARPRTRPAGTAATVPRPMCSPSRSERGSSRKSPATADVVAEDPLSGFCGAAVLHLDRGHPRGPGRPAPAVPAGAGRLPGRRPAGHPGPADGAPRRSGAVRVRIQGGHRAAGQHRAGGPDLGGGHPRRRAGGAGLGPRPAGRGHRRGADRRPGQPAGGRRGVRPGQRPPARRAGRPPGAAIEGEPDRRRGARRTSGTRC